MHQLILIRHGESLWNRENRFTGWTDVPLTERGIEEAKEAGRLLKQHGFTFDLAFVSVLTRALHSLSIILEELGEPNLATECSWRLNERHYGSLQGLNKAETAAKYGEQQVLIWRRSYDVPPPPLDPSDERWPGKDPRYAALKKEEIPLTESLKETVARVIPYWENKIVPALHARKKVLLVAHGNSIRALIKHLDHLSEEEVLHLNIPTAVPLIYELDDNLHPIRHYYLGDQAKIEAAIQSVASQGKEKEFLAK